MPLQLLNTLKNRASQMACNSALYNWSLNGPVPERLCVQPVDSWAGCADAGRILCDGALMYEGARVPVGESGWALDGMGAQFQAFLHGFSWLRDLRALSGERGMSAVARTHAKVMIRSWIQHYTNWHPQSWQNDVMGERLAMWLSAYEFFSAVEFFEAHEEDDFQDMFFESCVRQARHLSRTLSHDMLRDGGLQAGIGQFKAAKGLLYAGICFEDEDEWVDQALNKFKFEIDRQIAGDGAHLSRSPVQLMEILQILIDVRIALRAADMPLPEEIQHAIDRMGPALRFFQYSDKHFALFNGGQEGDVDCIAAVLRQAGVRGKVLSALPCTGYERATLGRTSLILDVGAPPVRPFGVKAHAAPLAFEMNYGRDRLFVNCGSHPFDEDWQEALRSTPAHTALSMDDRNACEIKGDTFARTTATPKVIREDLKNAVLLEASHDGYEALNGFTHKRRIYLSDQGHDIRGADILSAQVEPAKPVQTAVRFHLHPRVMVSLIRDGEEALLRMPGGVGWRFHHQGGTLALEDSVYMGQGSVPRKTKQLVIYGQISDIEAQIKWALQKEG